MAKSSDAAHRQRLLKANGPLQSSWSSNLSRSKRRKRSSTRPSTALLVRSAQIPLGLRCQSYLVCNGLMLSPAEIQGERAGSVKRAPQTLACTSCCTPRMLISSRSWNWSLIRPCACTPALRKWHMRRNVDGFGAGAGRVRCELWTASAGAYNFCNFCPLGRSIHS